MSLDFDIEYPMQSLYIAKIFYDHNRLDTLLDCLDDDITISWDELSQLEQTAVGCIFADSRYHYQPEKYIDRDHYRSDQDVYVLRDPLLTRYDNLCRRLEAAEGITKVENPFAKDLESAIHRHMQLSSYCYDYRWINSTADRKGANCGFLIDCPEQICLVAGRAEDVGIARRQIQLGLRLCQRRVCVILRFFLAIFFRSTCQVSRLRT
jgi:hypothetical protein